MTDKEAMQMALHAMYSAREFLATVEDHRARLQETRLHDAMREVRAALAQNNSDVVKLPTSTEEAIAMQRVSYAYLDLAVLEKVVTEIWQDVGDPRFPSIQSKVIEDCVTHGVGFAKGGKRINPHDLYTDVVSDGGMDPRNTHEEKPEATTVDKAIENLRDPWRRHEEKAFTPDWDAMAVMTEEIQRMAKRIEEIERKQEEKPEPVAWRTFDGEGGYEYRSYELNEDYCVRWTERNPNHKDWVEPLYAAPPKRDLIPLDDEELLRCECDAEGDLRQMAKLITQRILEKNK